MQGFPRATARLVRRPVDDTDAAFVLELLTDPDFVRFIGDRGVRDEASAHGYIERLREGYATHGFGLCVVTRPDGARLGLCGLVRREGLEAPDVGFAFLPAHRGKGYAREATLDTLAEAGALGLPSLLAICTPDNHASRKLLEGVGFRFQGLTRLNAGEDDLCLYRR
jgi:RimJ/RimL family protein N-acetyltransferase